MVVGEGAVTFVAVAGGVTVAEAEVLAPLVDILTVHTPQQNADNKLFVMICFENHCYFVERMMKMKRVDMFESTKCPWMSKTVS